MNAPPDGRMLRLRYVLDRPPTSVFRMLTEPAQLVRWWGPRGYSVIEVELNLEVGGTYRLTMQPPAGDPFHIEGEFQEIDPPERLAYTFRYEEPTADDLPTVVTLELLAQGEATEVSLTQGSFTTDERLSLHRDGWTDSFERLEEAIRQTP